METLRKICYLIVKWQLDGIIIIVKGVQYITGIKGLIRIKRSGSGWRFFSEIKFFMLNDMQCSILCALFFFLTLLIRAHNRLADPLTPWM